MGKKYSYNHNKEGEVIKVELRDAYYKVIYKNKFKITDKQAIINLLGILEKYSGLSVTGLIKQKINAGEWF